MPRHAPFRHRSLPPRSSGSCWTALLDIREECSAAGLSLELLGEFGRSPSLGWASPLTGRPSDRLLGVPSKVYAKAAVIVGPIATPVTGCHAAKRAIARALSPCSNEPKTKAPPQIGNRTGRRRLTRDCEQRTELGQDAGGMVCVQTSEHALS